MENILKNSGLSLKTTSLVLGLSLLLAAPCAALAAEGMAVAPQATHTHTHLVAEGMAVAPQAQQKGQVSGQVVDEFGEPMIGVTVQVKGQQGGTITDFDGNFSINVAPNATLILSYVGYQTKEVKASQAAKVQMNPDAIGLEETVVVGYGTAKKKDLLGAISQVKSEEITQAPTVNAMEGLQGRISGLDITRESGAAGTSPTILLRGNRSINGDNSPLFVIDGISGGNIDNLNPNDIESIEVLKDASSTAIYGSAGANGVIIVTTKQGKKGSVNVDFNAFCGFNAFPAYPETYVGQDWINYLNTGYEAYYGKSVYEVEGIDPNAPDAYRTYLSRLFNDFGLSTGEKNSALSNYLDGNCVNWKNEILKTGMQQNYNVSVRAGSDKITSYMSAGYMREDGMYRNDNYTQMNFRAGSTYTFNKVLTVGFQSNLVHKTRNSRSSRLSKALNEIPLGIVYNPDGSLNPHPTGNSNDYVNLMADEMPYAILNNTKSFNINVAPFIEIKPFKGLSYKTIFSASLSTSNAGKWEGLNSYYKLTGSSKEVGVRTASKAHNDSWGIQWQNILNYNFKIKEIHDIALTGVMEWNQNQQEYTNAANRDFGFDSYTWHNLGDGTQASVASWFKEKKQLSYAARVNYNLLGRYLLSATMRWDGASQLYDKWDSFPSVSAGWRVSDEKFMKGTRSWLDNLKLRFGWGVTGNSGIAPYSSRTMVEPSVSDLNLGGGQVHSYILTEHVANYSLTWEKSYNTNIGIDFGVLNGRIDGSFEYYFTNTKGVLYDRPLPTIYGLYNAKTPYSATSNIARIENKGVELTINSRNIQKKNFEWTTTFTFAKNIEELKEIDLGNGTKVDDLVALKLYLNNPVKTYYGYKKLGIWQLGEEDMAACFGLLPGQVHIDAPGLTWDPNYTYTGYTRDRITSAYTEVLRHGAYYAINDFGEKVYYRQGTPVVDENGKVTIVDENLYSINANKDKQILGHKQPDFTIGLTNNFRYRNFDLSIQAVMRWGFMTNGDLLGYSNAKNQPVDFDYWTPSNPTNAFPLAKLGISNEAKEAMLYVDGSNVRIKNITLGYSLDKKLLSKVKMSKFRIYATIQNPMIWCKDDMLKGLDPENTSSDFPLYKTIVFGINASF